MNVQQRREERYADEEGGEEGVFGRDIEFGQGAESCIIEDAAHHHDMQKPVGANRLHKEHVEHRGHIERCDTIADGQIQRKSSKAQDEQHIGQPYPPKI